MVGGNTQGDRLARVEAYLGMNADGTEAITPDCVADRLNQDQHLIEALRAEVEALRREQEIMKRAFSNPSTTIGAEPSLGRTKVPEPKSFAGVRDAKEIENFLWDME